VTPDAVSGLATTSGGLLLVFALMLPVTSSLFAFALGGRHAARIALLTVPAGLAVAGAIAWRVVDSGEALVYQLGGWAPPLGVALRADGISAAMLLTTSIVIGATALYARAQFGGDASDGRETRTQLVFWTMLLGLWGAMNAVLLGNDLFNLYVALELLTFSAIPLVSLGGKAETLSAALRYLIFALLGSALYLLGTALLYGSYGTLDIILLAGRVRPDIATIAACALMTVGLLAKTALFPMHFWLPPAHAGAPAAASAILSALVVKASFFLLLRLWFGVMPNVVNTSSAQLIAILGAGGILFGSVLALRQARLKLLVAYSTVAQIGYLFLMFPLITAAGANLADSADAWAGGLVQAISHALAKAAMFMAAGLVAEAIGHDRLKDLGGVGRALPVTVIAFGVGGISLMGLAPSGGYIAKQFLETAMNATGQSWLGWVTMVGGLLSFVYVLRVLVAVLFKANGKAEFAPVSLGRQAVTLGLALCAVGLGLLPGGFGILQIGRLPLGGGILP
jgi:formate hydrogenlyase subunit 3/multisubunit Na+/H+ antiporter MnhD subunit